MASQIILIIIGIAIVILLLSREGREAAIGICAVALGQDAKKRERKEKILELLKENPSTGSGNKELSNSNIREALGISAATAVRYMDELEKEGKVKQVGDTGNAVTYRLK